MQEDHREGGRHLSEIEYSLRSSVHSAIGVTPYFALYQLARRLNNLSDLEDSTVPKSVTHNLVRAKIRESLHKAYEKNERSYNTRCKHVKVMVLLSRVFIETRFMDVVYIRY